MTRDDVNIKVAEKTDPQFAAAYRRLADESKCDAWGGMESRRVYAEWVTAGRPEDIDAFIYRQANLGPFDN